MNTKELITWCWKNWWMFVCSLLLCMGLGLLYYYASTPKRKVSAAIMLRTSDIESQQGQMMSIIGEAGNKQAADEIKILTSHDLMSQIVDSLHLNITVERRYKMRWLPVYPNPEFAKEYTPAIKKKVYKREENGYKYRITVFPVFPTVDRMLGKLSVARLSRESQVIVLSTVTPNPKQAEAMINLLLTLYNDVSVQDKNAIALQTQAFLDERIAAVQQELNEAESTMEVYKSTHQITDIDATASEYQQQIEDYEQQLADINLDLRVLDDLEEQLKTPFVGNTPRSLFADFEKGTMSAMIREYNQNVAKRIALLESVTENNPMVQALDNTLSIQRMNIATGARDARISAQTRQKHLKEQINKYSILLAQLPEQERTYLEMKRNTETKEEQYVYLIQKREENSLFLASSSISAKVVEKARMSAGIISPSLKKIGVASVFFGFLLPLLIFFFGIFKREFF